MKLCKLISGLFLILSITEMSHGEEGRKTLLFGTLDYFGVGGFNESFEKTTNDAANVIANAGQPANAKTETKAGYGARFGIMFPIQSVNGFEAGGSIGYLVGPQAEQTLEVVGPPLGNGNLKQTTKTDFFRFLLEIAEKVKIRDNVSLRLGAGLGGVSCHAKENHSTSGSVLAVTGIASGSSSETWTGFTWEISPALVLEGASASFEIGLRYAQFPSKNENDNFDKIKWAPIGAYLGVEF